LKGFLEEIFDSENPFNSGSDSGKGKLSDKQRELQSKGNISNLFGEDITNKKKSVGERAKINNLKAAFSLFEPTLKIQKPDLYEKLNKLEISSSSDSESSDSKEDNLSSELNVDSSSDSSSAEDSIKNALKKVNTSKLILEKKPENLKVSKGKENKKLIKDDSLESLLKISDKKIKKVESSDSLERLLNTDSASESDTNDDPKEIDQKEDQKKRRKY